MTEKEKNIIMQELWALVAQDACAGKHSFEIMEKVLKCVAKEDANDMTPNKRKVVGEIQLQWRFVKTIREDLAKIAAKLGKSEIVPVIPVVEISNALWNTGNSGSSDALYEIMDTINDFQTAMQECIFKLQEVCE